MKLKNLLSYIYESMILVMRTHGQLYMTMIERNLGTRVFFVDFIPKNGAITYLVKP